MLVKYTVRVTEVVSDPGQGSAPESVFVVPNNSAFHLLIKNQGPGAVTVHQDGAFITPFQRARRSCGRSGRRAGSPFGRQRPKPPQRSRF